MEEVSSTTGLHLTLMDQNLLPQQRKLQPTIYKQQKRQLIDMQGCLQEASQQETFEQYLNNDNNESDCESPTPSGMKIVVAPQRFQRQVQVAVFLEGLRHFVVRKSVNLQKCEEQFSNQLKKLMLTFDYSSSSKLAQQALDTEQAFKLNQQEYPYLLGCHHLVKKSLSVQVKGSIKMSTLLKKVELYNPEDLSKITDKYFNPCGSELLATSDYLPSFKAMIGGSDYHLLSRENVQCEEQLLSRHHQFMRKNIKRVSAAQTASASPDIKHIQEMEFDKKKESGEISSIPTYLRQTESIKLKRVVRKEKNEGGSEQTTNPVFHLHTLDMIDNGNMIPHDSSRQLNSSPPIEGQKKADKIEKINLFSQIIKKETDQSIMVQDMISHKQFKSDRRTNPDSPTTGFFGPRAKTISSGPFRVTDIIKRLKSKYPNKKQAAHVLKIQEDPIKNEDEQQNYQRAESRDMQHDRDAVQGQALLDEQNSQHEETVARNVSSDQYCMEQPTTYMPFNTSVYGGCQQQSTNDGVLFKLASYDSNMLANQQILTREVSLGSRSGLLVGGRGLTTSPTTDLINLNDELIIAGTTYCNRSGSRITVYEQKAEDQHGSILQERVKLLQKLSEHQYQDKRQNTTLGPWNQGDQQLNLLKKAQQLRSENNQYISSSLPQLSKQQIELATVFQRQDSIGFTERKVNNSAGDKSPLLKRVGTKIFAGAATAAAVAAVASAHKRYSSLDNDQIYKRLAKSSLYSGSPNIIASNRGEPRGAALHSECLDFIIAETQYYKQQQSLQMIKAGLSIHAQTPEQVKNHFSKLKKVRQSSQLDKNDKKANDQNYTILTQKQITLPVVGQNTLDTQQKQDIISKQKEQNDYKNQRIAKLVDDHLKHRYSLMIKRLGNAQSVVIKQSSNNGGSAGPTMIDLNRLDMDSSDEETV